MSESILAGMVLSGPAPAFTKSLTGYRRVQILTGDTPERIAQRELGDAARWYDVINLNGLAPPWIVDDPALAVPGKVLLSAQDTLLVPSPAPTPSGVAETPEPFGKDLLLQNGQITESPSGDIQTVSGSANLVQAVHMRIGTRLAELVWHPTYGCRVWELLGRSNTPLNQQLAAAWVASSVRSDPRIAKVSNITASILGDAIPVTGTAVAIDGKRLPIGTPGAGV
jgi:phage baseplate assembly protein W